MISFGEVTVAVTSASVPSFINTVNSTGISIRDVTYVDDLNIRFIIKLSDYPKIRSITERHGDQLCFLDRSGFFCTFSHLLKRPVMILAFMFWIFLLIYLPGRILFFRVEGNLHVSDYEILNAAQQCGVSFGTSRRAIKSEKVKNALLAQIPQLKWVGVNTKGCVATISVKEGVIPDRAKEEHKFNNMIASIDGIVTEITIISGNPLCKVGQAVREGQVLVSGYTDCGLHIKSGEVDAEIYGITKRDISAIAIYPDVDRGVISSKITNYSIQIGKKMIKLKKCSGILDTACVKMYEKKVLTLPGGFHLPISLVKETVMEYTSKKNPTYEDRNFNWVKENAEKICADKMLAGQILYATNNEKQNEYGYHYSGYYICKEIIGKVRTEELFGNNGERNG